MRVSDETRRRAAELAARTGRHMQVVVDEALVAYERAVFWESFEDGYRRLASDSEAWGSVLAERRGEEPALRDRVE
ncbi:MAG: hypothetical protein GEU83_13535 [Pseudonocardiaceae bacterium]|nr:hypothetical protein [Pseudonocardiaceae bacterium]